MAIAQLMSGCETPEPVTQAGNASVVIEKVGPVGYTEFTVRFTPSYNTSSIRYAVGEESDFKAFSQGQLPDIETAEGTDATIHTFSNLEPGRTYTVFAVASDNEGNEGKVATMKIQTGDDKFMAETQYVTDCSAGFTFTITSNYTGGRYHLGKDNDREAFEKGDIGDSFCDLTSKTVNYFCLEEDTEYILFIQATDRGGYLSDITEIKIRTFKSGECPGAEFTYSNDIYSGSYKFVPNDKCSQITAFMCEKGLYDEMINSDVYWQGNIMAMLEAFEDSGSAIKSEKGRPMEFEFTTPSLQCGQALEIFTMCYDLSGNVTGVYKYEITTPEYNEAAGEATITVEVSDITTKGATCVYTAGEHTLAFLYDCVDADWFDDFRKNDPSYHEYYLHERFLSAGKYWSYNQKTVTYNETAATPGMRLYAAGCPMNMNGPNGGWGPLVLEEFTTLSE